ncbi:hypothetical protein Pcinc_039698 [Petrolisthes cinctipes]|uniref:Uncharacterized protein n=1 Tax=Petrolisthes cinctipes TaxID=88211 RepID=A0AAE1BR53_PETCI|nr:hypothetical protein Pcinc_039698 [Petrolisthes cinctipes]
MLAAPVSTSTTSNTTTTITSTFTNTTSNTTSTSNFTSNSNGPTTNDNSLLIFSTTIASATNITTITLISTTIIIATTTPMHLLVPNYDTTSMSTIPNTSISYLKHYLLHFHFTTRTASTSTSLPSLIPPQHITPLLLFTFSVVFAFSSTEGIMMDMKV